MLPTDLGSLADAAADQLAGVELVLLSYDSPDPCKISVEGSIRLPSSRVLALPIDVCQQAERRRLVITREDANAWLNACCRYGYKLMPGGLSTERAISTGCDVLRLSQFSRTLRSLQQSDLIRWGTALEAASLDNLRTARSARASNA